ncbi:MAG TPA: hypothetical protein VIL55_13420 [Naasia sp.]|jgi:hypothetical protein
MKRIRIADTLLLTGDAVAELVADYATLLARVNSADKVKLQAIDEGGDLVDASVVLTAATTVIVESTNSPTPDPPNEAAVAYIRGRLERWDAGFSEPAPVSD